MGERGEPGSGDRLGSYRLEEMLGEGSVGVVWRAIREPDGLVVALKVLRRELGEDETYRHRFVHEARAAGEVRERHLVPIVEAGEADGRPYLAVAYVKGRTLADRVEADGQLQVDDVVRLLAQAAAGLDALHRAGIVHRDVKPGNILLAEPDDAAMLTDFGLAKGPAYTVLTKPGQVMGTLDYLAPELIRGDEATSASDLYALGCVVYECVAGRPPFGDRGVLELAGAHLNEEPEDPFSDRSEGSSQLTWAILQALAKEPGLRPPTATAYGHIVSLAAAAAGPG